MLRALALALALPLAALAACDADPLQSLTPDTAGPDDAAPLEDTPAPDTSAIDALAPSDSVAPDAPALPDTDSDALGADAPDAPPLGPVRLVYDHASALAATASDLRFFDFPWPEARRLDPDGTPALAGFPNPADAAGCELVTADPIIGLLLQAIPVADYRAYVTAAADRRATGFGTNTPIYFRFDGPLGAPPTPLASLSPASPVFLVDVDPASPHRGRRVPLLARVVDGSLYLPPHTLALTPSPGFPLAPATRYAAVVLRSLGDASGAPLATPAAFDAALAAAASAPLTATDALYADALATLAAHGTAAADLAALTVFTTQDPLAPLRAAAAAIAAVADPAPLAAIEVTAVTRVESAGYWRISGTLNTLDFQRGTPPYLPAITPTVPVDADHLMELLSPGGWTLAFDPDDTGGTLLAGPAPAAPTATDAPDDDLPRTERIPFELTLPLAALDPGGDPTALPLVLYGHGTGGSQASPLAATREAPALAALGIATFAIPGVMHGPRAHAEHLDPALVADLTALGELLHTDVSGPLDDLVTGGDLFFNPLQVDAGRGNVLQSAVDFLFFARLFATAPLVLPAVDGAAPVTVTFDPARLGFFGHSQGGLTGPLTAFAPELDLTFLSAPGGHLASSLLTKVLPAEPFAVRDLFAWVICDAAPLDPLHPFFAAMTTFFEPADPLNYARLLVTEPVAGARHTFMTEGTTDGYATPPANEALTTAAGLTQVAPVLAPVGGQALLDALHGGFAPAAADLSANAGPPGARVTAAFKQYHGATGCSDDHFVYLCVPDARADWQRFFASWLTDVAPTVPAGP